MRLTAGLRLLWKGLYSRDASEAARFRIAEDLCALIYPKYKFSEFARIWLEDEAFFRYYTAVQDPGNFHSADRKFFLRSLLNLVHSLPGDTAECGVYKGASSILICEAVAGQGKLHHLFDSFEGLSRPGARDGVYWKAGHLAVDEKPAAALLARFDFVRVHKGWIPENFPKVAERNFCFVHIDVDLEQPTRDALAFFYSRVVPGGVILCDDYGFSTCPGAKQACDEFMADRPERIVHAPTGQAFIVKR